VADWNTDIISHFI